ncbi:hypothetical protein FEM48_Zijuj06G0116000 [Ziziphus jujuba var. spinosa]|uniref:Uncharacterized protein n=1 Tax=Ziziphus jujuba var. spinosa TaxID=714518 RepID=A0A978V923_ZIZJJ|nr:hypothetical protein FEM48_ZijujUnG0106400 [Ziziphus jujuba var. spinosa]KAH7524408.1 hypothetical protein FEM48_Zijuj06G0116000 [Ziziphus jujuba var. spinosa]
MCSFRSPKLGLLSQLYVIKIQNASFDKDSKYFLLLIRGTHSIKDTLIAASGAVVHFLSFILHDDGISNLVLVFAYCGMVVAARWIAKLNTPFLLKALNNYPDYKVKVCKSDTIRMLSEISHA